VLTDSLGFRSFVWTAGSRLASITAPTDNEGYTYNVFGTRAKVGTRTFLRAGVGVTAGVLADGNADYTPGISEVRSGTTTYSHSGLKHMAAQTGSGASVSATREYDAFGGVASSSGSWQGPFGAAGAFGYQTEASGLHLLGHRYYDASLGRFLSRDPIGDGSNWYAYCGNSPIGRVDADGGRWTYLYRLVSQVDGFLKYGISHTPKTRYSKRRLKELGDAEPLPVTKYEDRAHARADERVMVEEDPGPLNKEPWAGSKVPSKESTGGFFGVIIAWLTFDPVAMADGAASEIMPWIGEQQGKRSAKHEAALGDTFH
jgi:RHS repeat-associated protein